MFQLPGKKNFNCTTGYVDNYFVKKFIFLTICGLKKIKIKIQFEI